MDASSQTTISPPIWRRALLGRNPRVTMVRAAILAVSVLFIGLFVVRPVRLDGISMSPTYRHGSVNLLNRLAYINREPQRGDVVCIKTTGMRHMYMKRVVGLPGEHVVIRNGHVFIDGVPLDEPYVAERSDWNWEQHLEPNDYLLIGDNRGMRHDWHWWGVVSRERIAGRVVW